MTVSVWRDRRKQRPPLSFPAKAGNPVRRALSVIARSGATKQSRATQTTLDCFAALAMTAAAKPNSHLKQHLRTYARLLAARSAPELCPSSHPLTQRAQGR